jgi:hypothetical protein
VKHGAILVGGSIRKKGGAMECAPIEGAAIDGVGATLRVNGLQFA